MYVMAAILFAQISSWLPAARPADAARNRRAAVGRSRALQLVAGEQPPPITQQASSVADLLRLTQELLALQATPLSLAQLTDAIDYPSIDEEASRSL